MASTHQKPSIGPTTPDPDGSATISPAWTTTTWPVSNRPDFPISITGGNGDPLLLSRVCSSSSSVTVSGYRVVIRPSPIGSSQFLNRRCADLPSFLSRWLSSLKCGTSSRFMSSIMAMHVR